MLVPYIDMIYYLLVCVYLSKPTTFAKQHTTKFHNQNKTYINGGSRGVPGVPEPPKII